MKTLIILTLCSAFLVAGCTQSDRYPLSGDECKPGDPVQTMNAPNCLPVL